jgi:hypothetical protein
MTTLQKMTALTLVAAGLGLAAYQSKQAASSRAEVAQLKTERAGLSLQLADLQSKHLQLSNQFTASLQQSNTGLASQQELLRLRGEVALLRSRAAAAQTASPSQTSPSSPASTPGSIAFNNADISQVLAFYTNLTGLNLVIDPGVSLVGPALRIVTDLPTREAAVKLIQKEVLDHTGIVITPIDGTNASITYNRAWPRVASQDGIAPPPQLMRLKGHSP